MKKDISDGLGFAQINIWTTFTGDLNTSRSETSLQFLRQHALLTKDENLHKVFSNNGRLGLQIS